MNNRHLEMIELLAENLLFDVYHPVSLCIWVSDQGQILKLQQFDTAFAKPQLVCMENAEQVLLLSSHPDGDMRPGAADLRNITSIRRTHAAAQCRLFVVSEDEGIREIEI